MATVAAVEEIAELPESKQIAAYENIVFGDAASDAESIKAREAAIAGLVEVLDELLAQVLESLPNLGGLIEVLQ